jgi:uncharacterized protein (TIGR02301 family)
MGEPQTGGECRLKSCSILPPPLADSWRPMSTRALACAVLFAAVTAAPAGAQQPQPAPAARGEDWYRGQLVELSEVLGGSHYLRILCEGRGDQRWRDYMRGVIEREPQYNAVLVEGFNRGYRTEEARFPTCDATTRQMEAELRARGLRIAQALSARHTAE